MAETINSKGDRGARGADTDSVEQADTLAHAPTVPITTDERLARIEQMLEGLLTFSLGTVSTSSNSRTDAIYAEIDRIHESMTVRRERAKVNSARIVNNLARFDVLAGGRL